MHQDQRIGLALAVLLIGAAGAFCFRNDPKPASPSLRLKTARELDARIAEKSIGPYLQNQDERDGLVAKNVSTPTGSDAGQLPQLDTPDFLGPEQSSSDNLKRGSDTIQELAPIPIPDNIDRPGTQATGESVAKSSGPEKRHVVQKGETLSSIAARELGSSVRFQEIFEANRDQLSDADAVRVGMSLRIPDRNVKPRDRLADSAPPLLPSDSSSADAREFPALPIEPARQPTRSADNSPVKKKFEPVKRPPLGIKGLGAQSSDTTPTSRPTRKLTQLPPSDAGGKVAR